MDTGDQTLIYREPPDPVSVQGPLRLFYRDTERQIYPGDTPLTMGRGAGCALLVETAYASRRHCTIEYRQDKYFLVDHSTNGTWVKLGLAVPLHVHNEAVPLAGSGCFRLGRASGEDSELILFKL
jgi:adenylate cyclase